MLLRVSQIRDYGVFASFDWPEGLPDFSRRNLIYGWNYSGKTTLSRIFRSIGLGEAHGDFASGRFEVLTDAGARITAPDQAPPFPIHVFNSDYVRDNLKWTQGVEPILILGARNQELEDRRERLSRLVERLQGRRQTLEEEKASIGRAIDDDATKAAQTVRQTLDVQPFSRAPHLDAVVKVVDQDPDKFRLSDQEYREQYTILKAEQRHTLVAIPAQTRAVPQESLEATFNATAQQSAIEALKEDSVLESWVEAGLSLHHEGDACKFCGGPLPSDLLEHLSAHFSDSLRALRQQIESLKESLRLCRVEPSLFDEANLYEDLRPKYADLRERLQRSADRINDRIDSISAQLENKKTRVDESYQAQLEVDPRAYLLHDACVARINQLIGEHNRRVANLSAVRDEAREKLIRHHASAYVRDSDLNGRRKRIAALDDMLETVGNRQECMTAELSLVDGQISDEVLGADRVNEYLRSFFGSEDICIEVRADKRYTLSRAGRPAKNLSEGEKTAISFSYFLAQLEGKDARLKESVVYIDDPVSSLDSNHLYNTYAVIKDALQDARQVFVSTHDYGFYKLLRSDSFFAEFSKKDVRRGCLYVVKRGPSGAKLEPLPDLLKRYNSEYHYLFSIMYAFHCDPEADDTLPMVLPNLVRRVLETYTSFRVPKTSIKLDQRLKRLCKDDATALRIYKFVNYQSHSDSLGGVLEFPHTEECKDVVDLVLEMMSADCEHCDGMIELCELH